MLESPSEYIEQVVGYIRSTVLRLEADPSIPVLEHARAVVAESEAEHPELKPGHITGNITWYVAESAQLVINMGPERGAKLLSMLEAPARMKKIAQAARECGANSFGGRS